MRTFLHLRAGVLAIVLAVAVRCEPQAPQSSAGITSAQVESAVRAFLRDSGEFPLRMDFTLVATEVSGRIRERKTGHVKYDFHGFNPRSHKGAATMEGSRGSLRAAEGAFIAGMLPVVATVVNQDEKEDPMVVSDLGPSSPVATAKIPMRPQCTQIQWSIKRSAPEQVCGAAEFQLRRDDLTLQHFSFEAGGLPMATEVKPFGKCQLRRYHVEEEFQKTFIAGDPKLFLVPKSIEVTVETDKGTVVLTSQLTARK